MHIPVRFSSAIHVYRGLVAAIFLGVPLVLAGCGIPDLRGPDPLQPLPQRFDDANNMNYFNNVPPAPAPAADYYMGQVDSSDDADSGRFQTGTILASFARAAHRLNRQADDPSDAGTTIVAGYEGSTDADAVDNAAGSNSEPARLSVVNDGPDDQGAGDDDREVPEPAEADGTENHAAEAGEAPARLTLDPPIPDGGTGGWQGSPYTPYYQYFNDPILAGLIDQALMGNQELKILTQEIDIANFEIMARQGAYLPFVTIGDRIELEKPSLYTPMGAVEDQLDVLPGKPFPDPLPDFLAGAQFSWELDIWRKLRNARDAAGLRYLAARERQNYVITTLVAEVAENYYELMALDNRLAILDATIKIQQDSLAMAEAKKAAARGTELAVQRFRAEVQKNQSQKLIIQQEIVEAENRINFLLGRYPQHVVRDSSNYLALNPGALNLGVPSQLLANRADVRQAERELAAAGLDVRVARAQFFPSLILTGGVGFEAFNPKYLFHTPESLVYNVAGDLVAPLINKKAIRADYLTANAVQLQAVYKYQQTLLNAFTQVINRMAKVQNYGQSIEIKRQQLQSLEASVASATDLFQNARAEYVEVLLAQRDMMEAKMVLVETKQEQLAASISAYQALGGGAIQMPGQ